jgi:hypothetical protein
LFSPAPRTKHRPNRSSAPSIRWSGASAQKTFAVAELGAEDAAVKKIAVAFKESRRIWFRDLLIKLKVANADDLATQLTLLVDGSIAQDLVRNDPSMARAAKQAARVLLENAGVEVGGHTPSSSPPKRRPIRQRQL